MTPLAQLNVYHLVRAGWNRKNSVENIAAKQDTGRILMLVIFLLL